MNQAMSQHTVGRGIGRARAAGVLTCLVGTCGTGWTTRHAWGLLHNAAATPDAVATCAFAIAVAFVCGWLTVLTALATAALDDVGAHSDPTQLHDRLVRRIAATLLVVAGGTGAGLMQVGATQPVRVVAASTTGAAPTPQLELAAVAAPAHSVGSLDTVPDPSFAGSGWTPRPPVSATESDGSLLTGVPHTSAPTAEVVVRRGDSLWSLVSRQLGAGADPAHICSEVRRWYDANRQLIGADPDLLLPGQILHAPADRR